MSALVAFLVAVNPPVIAASLPRSVSMRAIVIAAALAAALVLVAPGSASRSSISSTSAHRPSAWRRASSSPSPASAGSSWAPDRRMTRTRRGGRS